MATGCYEIHRAAEVEPQGGGLWSARLMDGTLIGGGFRRREDALAAERLSGEERLIAGGMR